MPHILMAPLTRPPSRDITPTRRLSRDQTYHLAETARRKSSDKFVREDLRLSLSHGHLLEQLLMEIARTERELQTSPTEEKFLLPQERSSTTTSSQSNSRTTLSKPQFDEYGFPLDHEDEDEDSESSSSLSLTRTQSRRPTR